MDTGAQANLIKKWLVANLAKPCKRPLRLVTANGDVLPGGDIEVDLMVHFRERGVDVGPGKERVWRAKGCVHEAEIEDEMILGYPWLQENRVAVLSGTISQDLGKGVETSWREAFDQVLMETPRCFPFTNSWGLCSHVLWLRGLTSVLEI